MTVEAEDFNKALEQMSKAEVVRENGEETDYGAPGVPHRGEIKTGAV